MWSMETYKAQRVVDGALCLALSVDDALWLALTRAVLGPRSREFKVHNIPCLENRIYKNGDLLGKKHRNERNVRQK